MGLGKESAAGPCLLDSFCGVQCGFHGAPRMSVLQLRRIRETHILVTASGQEKQGHERWSSTCQLIPY